MNRCKRVHLPSAPPQNFIFQILWTLLAATVVKSLVKLWNVEQWRPAEQLDDGWQIIAFLFVLNEYGHREEHLPALTDWLIDFFKQNKCILLKFHTRIQREKPKRSEVVCNKLLGCELITVSHASLCCPWTSLTALSQRMSDTGSEEQAFTSSQCSAAAPGDDAAAPLPGADASKPQQKHLNTRTRETDWENTSQLTHSPARPAPTHPIINLHN